MDLVPSNDMILTNNKQWDQLTVGTKIICIVINHKNKLKAINVGFYENEIYISHQSENLHHRQSNLHTSFI